jgi:hypothetical protein
MKPMRNIRWRYYVWRERRPVEPAEIELLQASWGVRLPEEYKKLVSEYQGMSPEPSTFRVGRVVKGFNTLLAITRDSESESYSVQHCDAVLRPLVPSGIHPFGDTPGGEYLCFDYRDSPEQPRIVLVSVEAHVHLVANGFQEFMDGLYDD